MFELKKGLRGFGGQGLGLRALGHSLHLLEGCSQLAIEERGIKTLGGS